MAKAKAAAKTESNEAQGPRVATLDGQKVLVLGQNRFQTKEQVETRLSNLKERLEAEKKAKAELNATDLAAKKTEEFDRRIAHLSEERKRVDGEKILTRRQEESDHRIQRLTEESKKLEGFLKEME